MLNNGRRRLHLGAFLALLVGLSASACTGSGAEQGNENGEPTTPTDVPFADCEQAQCTGEIDGAAFEIVLPKKWNGALLLYSHGYRQAHPAPPDFAEPSTAAEPAPGWSSGVTAVGDALLEQGYALAGSAYASNGWAVEDGVQAGEALHGYFVKNIGKPEQVYVWGDSLGGLVTELIAEQNADWVTGAAPLCGVLAGPTANLDLALDVAYAVKTLLYPSLRLTGYESWEDASSNWQAAFNAILAAGTDVQTGVPKILAVAALVDAPDETKTYDGSTVESQVRAKAEGILTALGYGTYGRYEIEQRFGGNPSTNVDADYGARLSDTERTVIDTVGGVGTAAALVQQLEAGERVTADAAAREAFTASGTPTGAVEDPTITLHTVADPLVLVQNEKVFADRVAEADAGDSADVVQLYSVPPATYPADPGAPYGAGHCNFSLQERLGVVSLLDGWARGGVHPDKAAIRKAFAENSGVDVTYRPPDWPADLED